MAFVYCSYIAPAAVIVDLYCLTRSQALFK